MRELNEIIANSTQRIEYRYINLPIDHGIPTYRERVYCYELYHQMRCLWPKHCPYVLNGEVDKRGHPILRRFGLSSVPDFLVHSPGRMAGNHAVIEVKSRRATAHGINKDLETLSRFVLEAGYERAIYLMYDTHTRNYLFEEIWEIYRAIEGRAAVEVWLHRRPGEGATLAGVLTPDEDAEPDGLVGL